MIRRISRDFVPVALNVEPLEARKGADGDFFRLVKKQRPEMSQGIYVLTPEGKVLATHAKEPPKPRSWPRELLDTLDAGLSTFGPVTARLERRPGFLPHRGKGLREDGGISLAAYMRFMHLGLDRRGFGTPTYDSVDLTREQAARLGFASARRGDVWDVPASVVERFHVVLSPTSGKDTLARADEVTLARLQGKVERVRDGTAYLSYEGKIEGSHRGIFDATKNKRMYAEMPLRGVGSCDAKTGELLSMTLVGEGRVKPFAPYDQWNRFGAVVEWKK